MNIKTLLALASGWLFVVALGCGTPETKKEVKAEAPATSAETKLISLSPEAMKTAGITVQSVSIQSLQESVTVNGTVKPTGSGEATVTPPVAGKITKLFASMGDQVSRGQPLATIDSPDLAQGAIGLSQAQSAVSSSQSGVQQAQADLRIALSKSQAAERNLRRQRELAQAGAFAQAPLQAAQNELNDAQSENLSSLQDREARQVRLRRAERLHAEGLVSTADLQQAVLDSQQAELRVQKSLGRLDIAKSALEREKKIAKAGFLNAREVQAAEAEASGALLEVEKARSQLGAARNGLDASKRAVSNAGRNYVALRGNNPGSGSSIKLVAPMSGVITERKATIGQAVERSSDLFDITNLGSVWVTASVPDKDAATVRNGARVTVTTDSIPGKMFLGRVAVVGQQLDPKSRTLPIQCLLLNPGLTLKSEMFARVSIATGRTFGALAVPNTALVKDGEDQFVFVSKEGKFEKRSVKTGRSTADRIEVTDGLKAGEQIATSGVFVLVSESRRSELKGEG